MSNQIQVLNERWPSKYTMVCDVVDSEGSLVENISLQIDPMTSEKSFSFPDEYQQCVSGAIENALLWRYFDLPKEDDL